MLETSEALRKIPTVSPMRWEIERKSSGTLRQMSAAAEDYIKAYYKNIVEKWMNFFVLKKRVRCTQITKKVK